jgi:hypothetical protein
VESFTENQKVREFWWMNELENDEKRKRTQTVPNLLASSGVDDF